MCICTCVCINTQVYAISYVCKCTCRLKNQALLEADLSLIWSSLFRLNRLSVESKEFTCLQLALCWNQKSVSSFLFSLSSGHWTWIVTLSCKHFIDHATSVEMNNLFSFSFLAQYTFILLLKSFSFQSNPRTRKAVSWLKESLWSQKPGTKETSRNLQWSPKLRP